MIEAYTAEGGNPNTAATQYAYWKKAYDVRHGSKPAQFGSVGRMRLSVGSDGRITIPAEMRDAMLLRGESAVTAEVVEGELRILSPAAALERVRALVAKHDKGEGSPVDELIAERRAEARREDSDEP
ncbi:AbrB/MazE/SpoVT family DNA-binding domain-containing protein [Jiella marina]|uniref:AbrB/MazE/SpoVT family DNA-binding domain-containing protein n=1 Tax=Jiella sp. LLJ827 TaxID=2917712 RepID=UPI002101D351|nr:AbrB/MazE/SpoVT family DNA-binding domain-containing protein [Jiella sp. LLJ827]MCQ0986914.1 AbrB/MazE/SpoVT family DNA-binding domain-containing protein [Jiella sp. LLJ827]